MPSLALVCIHASVLMMVCHPSPSGISSRFIGTIGTTGDDSSGSGSSSGGITFLFLTLGIGIQMTTSDLDLLRRL